MLSPRHNAPLPPLAALRATNWEIEMTSEGTSMEPLVRAGDVVTIACVETDTLKVGDIVCYQNPGGFVLHRLVEMHQDQPGLFFEKGDAETGGRWIQDERILGRLIRINGEKLDSGYSRQAMRISRWEQSISRGLRAVGLSPVHPALASRWRDIKMKWLDRGAANR